MRTWAKLAAALLVIATIVMILAPRLWVKNSNSHLVVDGRVSGDFKLYFGPNGKLLLRLGAKKATVAFVFLPQTESGPAEVLQCSPNEVSFPPFFAIAKHVPPRCPVANEKYLAVSQGNKLLFRTKDGHIYEVTWQPPGM
jgi:hypothetical protein